MKVSLLGVAVLVVLAPLSQTTNAADYSTPLLLPSAVGLAPRDLPALSGTMRAREIGQLATYRCGDMCDEIHTYQRGLGSRRGPYTKERAVVLLKLGIIHGVTWTYPGEMGKPRSYPSFRRIFPDSKLPPDLRETDAIAITARHGLEDFYIRDLAWTSDGVTWTARVLSPITKRFLRRARKATINHYRVVEVTQGEVLPRPRPPMPAHVSYATPEERAKYKRTVPDLDEIPTPVFKPDPAYPPYPRNHDIMGTVIVRVRVNRTGDVSTILILESHPLFDESVVQSVTRWRYVPLIIEGVPKPWDSNVTLKFRLR